MFDCRGQFKSQKVLEKVKTGKQSSTILPVKHKIAGGGGGGGGFFLVMLQEGLNWGFPSTVDG